MSEAVELPSGAARFRDGARKLGLDPQIFVFPKSTRTAAEAAAAIGCEVAQIAKSLIFRSRARGTPVLVVASGANRVDEGAVARALAEPLAGEDIERADPDFVRDVTGYAIGGVPPIGHAVRPLVAIDRDLLSHDVIWAAAGAPNAVFRTSPGELVELTGGVVAAVAQGG